MASLTFSASFLRAAPATVAERPATHSRSLIVARATSGSQEGAKLTVEEVDSKLESSGRRAAMFAVAAAAISAAGAGIAVAGEDEPKRGTPEARKAYSPICVTMPTARICHK